MEREEALEIAEDYNAVFPADPRSEHGKRTCKCRGLERDSKQAQQREGIVLEALGARSSSGLLQFILSLLRRRSPGSTQVILHGISSETALEVLKDRTRVYEGLDRKIISYTVAKDGFETYLGWYSFCWSGGDEESEGFEDSNEADTVKKIEMISLPYSPPHPPETLVFVSDSEKAAKDVAAMVGRTSKIPKSRYQVFSSGKWHDAPKFEREVREVSWDKVVLPEETISGIRNSVERFFDRREEYEKLGFAWRRGILLVGPTGTGKTMLTKAIAASKPDIPFLYVRDFAMMGAGHSVSKIFAEARSLAPAILALEDIDGLVSGGATRSLFLNELDGFTNNDGLLVVASSNHPEKVDEALLKRPSRFDRVFHIGFPAFLERERYLTSLLVEDPLLKRFSSKEEAQEAAHLLARRSEGLAPTHLKEAVISEALELSEGEREKRDFSEGVLIQIESLKRSLKSADSPEELGKARPAGRSMGFGSNG